MSSYRNGETAAVNLTTNFWTDGAFTQHRYYHIPFAAISEHSKNHDENVNGLICAPLATPGISFYLDALAHEISKTFDIYRLKV